MRVVVTNDDGIDAPGLRAMAGALARAGHQVTAVAPIADHSGAGTAMRLPIDRPITVRRMPVAEVPGVPFIGVDGTPGLAVLLSRLGAFGDPPWCVVSGINPGGNTGRSILHSGTVGSALTAASLGMSALAVSVHAEHPRHLAAAAQVAAAATDWLRTARKRTVLNVNIPDSPLTELRGVRWARLAAYGETRATVDEVGERHVRLRSAPATIALDPQTDAALVVAGYVVVTPISGPRAIEDDEPARGIGALLSFPSAVDPPAS